MKNAMTTLWITKYALSSGIQEMEQKELLDTMAIVHAPGHYNGVAYFHGKDWHVTKAAAIEDAERRRSKKITALEKQIEKLKKMNFSVID